MSLALSLIKYIRAIITLNTFELETFRFIVKPLSVLFK